MTMQVIPAYARQHLAAGAVAAGLAVTIGSLATMLARPIAGRWADQLGGRPIIMTGALLGAVGALAHLAATTIPMLIGARLILGAGEGAVFTAALGWVLSGAAPARRGQIAGHFGLSMWSGLAGGPVLGAALLAISGYRAVWLLACCLPIIAWLLLLRTPNSIPTSTPAKAARRALFPREARLPAASIAFASIGYGVIAAFLVPRFAALRLPGEQFALAIFGVAFMLTRFLGSPAVDRCGASAVLVLALIVETLGLLGLSLASKPWLVFSFTVVAGAGISMVYPCLASLVAAAAQAHERSAALGSMTSAWDLGLAIGGPLGGVVAGATNAGPFAIAAIAALLAMLPRAARPRPALAPLQRS
jgi:MFS family permease